jgi:hypothetical protein
MMDHGACMVRLTRLSPSKHVLNAKHSSNFENQNKIRDINEFIKN